MKNEYYLSEFHTAHNFASMLKLIILMFVWTK